LHDLSPDGGTYQRHYSANFEFAVTRETKAIALNLKGKVILERGSGTNPTNGNTGAS